MSTYNKDIIIIIIIVPNVYANKTEIAIHVHELLLTISRAHFISISSVIHIRISYKIITQFIFEHLQSNSENY